MRVLGQTNKQTTWGGGRRTPPPPPLLPPLTPPLPPLAPTARIVVLHDPSWSRASRSRGRDGGTSRRGPCPLLLPPLAPLWSFVLKEENVRHLVVFVRRRAVAQQVVIVDALWRGCGRGPLCVGVGSGDSDDVDAAAAQQSKARMRTRRLPGGERIVRKICWRGGE